MNHRRILRILSIALILSLLIITLPATPALAATVTISPNEGAPGTTVTITGSSFTAGNLIDIYFDTNLRNSAFASPVGAISVTITVPGNATAGVHQIRTFDFNSQLYLTTTDFTVTGIGEITLDPDEGIVGTEVEINGEGFDSSEDIAVEYDGDEINIENGDTDTDSSGEFTCTVIIPPSTAGDHTITVIGQESDSEAEADFTVEPQITISPTSGSSGTVVTVNGTGFSSNADITIDFNNDEMTISGDTDTDSDGSFTSTFTVQTSETGVYDVDVEDEDNNADSAVFTISTNASLDNSTGSVGAEITISGTGFIAGGPITAKYDDFAIGTAVADSNGAFSIVFNIPPSIHGDHTVTVSDGTTTRESTFVVESEPPPAPQLLLPETGIKAKQPVYFDWADVTDVSIPVSYTLQIASDQDFTTASIVLEEDKIAASEYTIANNKKLESVSEEAPYYWRVKAVDAASNQSGWSTPSSFTTGFSFNLPTWAIYFLSVVGGLLLLFVGFWLGRKTALY